MKTQIGYIPGFLLLLSVSCQGQTKEQKEAIKKSEKMMAEMERKRDSLMNTAHAREMIKQIEEMAAQQEVENKAIKAYDKTKQYRGLSALPADVRWVFTPSVLN